MAQRLHIARLLAGLGVTLLFCLHAFDLIALPLVDKLEQIAYDARLKLAMPATEDSRIVIVDLDEKSLAKVGRWPWGRHHLARLTETLFDHYRILALGFDVVFAEQDESSGLPVLDELATGPLAKQNEFLVELKRLRPTLERDEQFARAMRGRPVMLGYYFKNQTSGDGGFSAVGALPDPVISLEELGIANIPFTKANGFGANLPLLQNAAQNGGFFDNPLVDDDGVHRRMPILQEYRGRIYQSLSLSLVRTILGDPPITLGITPVAKSGKEVETGLEWVGLGPHHIPVDEKASILIPYRGRQGSFPYVSAADILDKSVNTALLADAIVLVGSTAPGLMDLRSTPVQNVYPGVEVHANVISGILENSIKRWSPHALTIELFDFLLIGLALTLLLPRLTPTWGFYLTLLLLVLIVWSNAFFWRRMETVIPLASPLLLTFLLYLLQATFSLFMVSRNKSQLTRLFGRHLPPEAVEELNRNGQGIALSSERREMSVLFARIQGFTAIAEQMAPQDLSALLNAYLSRMTALIHAQRGTVDKYMGDGIMAFWGAPLDNPRHARAALKCALLMAQATHELKDEFRAKGWPQLRIGIGVNTGSMVVGNMGSDFRMVYTALGDAVNHASRLEKLTRQYGVAVIVGEETRKAVPEVIFRELDRVRVADLGHPVALFEPVGFVDEVGGETRAEVDSYHRSVALYRGRRWPEARERFQLLLQRDPERMIYDIYLSRLQHLLDHPLPGEWDGVFVQVAK